MYFRLNALPGATTDILTVRNSTGVIAKAQIISTNKIRISDSASTLRDFLVTLVTGQWYRLEMQVTPGASTTTGRVQAAYYLADATTTPTGETGTFPYDSGTTVNAGTTVIDNYRFGKISSASGTMDGYIDDLAWSDAAAGAFIGPVAAPPTSAFTSSTRGLTVDFDGSGSTAVSPASVTNYAWTFGDSTTGTGVTPTHNYSAAGTYTVGLIVTDSNGTVSSNTTHSVTVAAPAATVGVNALVTTTGFTAVNTGSIFTAVTDNDVTTVARSATTPTNAPFRVRLGAHVTPQPGTDQTVTVELRYVGATTGSVSAILYEGTTVRATAASQPITSTLAVYTFVFPAASIANVANWNAVDVQLSCTAS
jgi:PKD repeat protein